MIPLKNDMFKEKVLNMIHERLMEGAVRRELIDVSGERNIGKTTALIKFAMEFGFYVVVPSSHIAKKLADYFGYLNIFGANEASKFRGIDALKGVVIDEGVDRKLMSDFPVITGLYSYGG
jgi:hypothetical protein